MLNNVTDLFTLLISYFTENAMGSTFKHGYWLVRRMLAFERKQMKQTWVSENRFYCLSPHPSITTDQVLSADLQ